MIETTAEKTLDAEQPPEVRSAEIIPFRRRPVAAHPAPVAQPTDVQQRLARALEMLNAAMAEQRSAMAQWRNALGALKTSTTGLGDSLQRYQANLTSLSQGVSALRTQAKSLQTWAEKAAATD